jgi:hypothetical protein
MEESHRNIRCLKVSFGESRAASRDGDTRKESFEWGSTRGKITSFKFRRIERTVDAEAGLMNANSFVLNIDAELEGVDPDGWKRTNTSGDGFGDGDRLEDAHVVEAGQFCSTSSKSSSTFFRCGLVHTESQMSSTAESREIARLGGNRTVTGRWEWLFDDVIRDSIRKFSKGGEDCGG